MFWNAKLMSIVVVVVVAAAVVAAVANATRVCLLFLKCSRIY